MTERHVELPDGRRIRAGTAEDAAKLWTSKRKPDGVTTTVYRDYVRRAKTAPGPIMVADLAEPTKQVPLRDGVTGAMLFDLDEVERANAARLGGGRHSSREHPDTLRHTVFREDTLTAARDGRIRVNPGSGHVELDGARPGRRPVQAITEMRQLGMLTDPAPDTGLIRITDIGTAALARWAHP